MNTQKNELQAGRDYAEANSPLARFIEEQHRLLDKARVEIRHLKENLDLIEKEADYWRAECDKADASIRMFERLRKAGDEMAEQLIHEHKTHWQSFNNDGEPPLRYCVAQWLAAKEGSDAK